MYYRLAILLLTPALLFGESHLTLRDCFKAALKRSDELATQQELIIQAEELYRESLGQILPSVAGSYTYFRRSTPGLVHGGNTALSVGQHVAKVSATQPLFRGFRDFAALSVAKDYIVAQEQSRQWAGMQLYGDVARAFYTRLAVEKDLSVLDNQLEYYQKRIDELQERVTIGRSRLSELLTVQVAREVLAAERQQVLGQVAVSKEMLVFLTGLDPALPLDDSDPVPSEIPSVETYRSLIPARPDIMAARSNVAVAGANVGIARGAFLPSADFIANYYKERPDVRLNGRWDMQVAVTMPIFTGGILSSQVRTAKSQARESEYALSQVERFALEEVNSFYDDLTSDLAQLQILERALNLAQENYKANLKDSESNLVSNLEVLVALSGFKDTERSYERIRYRVKLDSSNLDAAVARALPLMEELEHR